MRIERRLKQVSWEFHIDPSKQDLIGLLNSLPSGTVLVSVSEDLPRGIHQMIFQCKEWDEVPDGGVIPQLLFWFQDYSIPITLGDSDLKELNSTVSPANIPFDQWSMKKLKDALKPHCLCDLAYTGLKDHKLGCPLRIK